MIRAVAVLCTAVALSGCSYVGTWAKQSYYSYRLRHSPRQRISKHLLERKTFFVFGKVVGSGLSADTPLATG